MVQLFSLNVTRIAKQMMVVDRGSADKELKYRPSNILHHASVYYAHWCSKQLNEKVASIL